MRRSTLTGALALAITAATATAGVAAQPASGPDDVRLTGRSVLPADTFVPGSEPSGYFTGNPAAPFPGQPVQGFSAVHALGDGSLLAMSDNGFGNKQNSRDFLLAVHRIAPDAGSGETTVLDGGFNLSDPEGHVPWTIWRDGGCAEAADLPAGYACPEPDRLLTGWDFDIESMQVAKDGTFWFGDEFGPFLLHTDAEGRLLEAPIPTPGVASPSNPTLTAPATLPSSKGFEGMAVSPNGRHLYPMLEGATEEDKAAGLTADLRIYDVALHPEKGAAFTGDYLRYRMESAEHAIGDLIAVNAHQLLVIERDSLEGDAARFKAIYLVDTRDRDGDGYVEKELLVDLLAVPDPDGVGGTGETFAFPFFTIEDVEILDERTIAVLNDNNYPDHGGRGDDVLDANELITIELAEPLRVDHRLLPRG